MRLPEGVYEAGGKHAGRLRIDLKVDGVRFQKLLPRGTKAREAARIVREARRRLAAGEETQGRRTRLSTALEAFLEERAVQKPRSAATRRALADQVLASPRFNRGAMPLKSFSAAVVRAYLTDRTRAGASPSTRNRHLSFILSAARWWSRPSRGWISSKTYEAVREIPKGEEPPPRTRELWPEDERRLLAACDGASFDRDGVRLARKGRANPAVKRIVLAALLTGRRVGELVALRKAEVRLDARRYVVPRAKNGRAMEFPLVAAGVEVFREAMAASPCEHVFTNREGKPWTTDGLRSSFDRVRARAGYISSKDAVRDGLPETASLIIHDLRRTFGGRALRGGVALDRVSQLLNHKDISTTRRHYAHLLTDDLDDALSTVDLLSA